jgi:glycosyltransferase involved in cell wall biosynthesis
MTAAIDCRHIDSSGIGVYIRECLPFFLESDNQFLLIGDTAKLAPLTAGHTNAETLDCPAKPFSLREVFAFPRSLLKKINRCDLYYSPYFNIPGGITVPVYTTIHDIVFPDIPELVSKAGLAARMRFYRRAFVRSRKIFTVSEFSKSRIEHYAHSRLPVIVTHSAIQPLIIRRRNRAAAKKETIVFIGNIKKHKGLDCLLDAFLSARADGLRHRLIIIGSRDNFRSSDNAVMRKIGALDSDAVAFTGFISDELLLEYVSTASLLVQPSLYEGFGLPPLEAMALGTPALISDIPAFREIYAGFPVVFFRAGDSADLKDKLLEMLRGRKPAAVELPPELLFKYTFEKTAHIILRELESAPNEKRQAGGGPVETVE